MRYVEIFGQPGVDGVNWPVNGRARYLIVREGTKFAEIIHPIQADRMRVKLSHPALSRAVEVSETTPAELATRLDKVADREVALSPYYSRVATALRNATSFEEAVLPASARATNTTKETIMTIKTKEVEKLSGPDLVRVYNAITDKPVKKFSNQAMGVTRVLTAIKAVGEATTREKLVAENMQDVADKIVPVTTKTRGGNGTSKTREPRWGGRKIGPRAKELIKQGKEDDDILKTIHAEFPGARTSKNDMRIYRRQVAA